MCDVRPQRDEHRHDRRKLDRVLRRAEDAEPAATRREDDGRVGCGRTPAPRKRTHQQVEDAEARARLDEGEHRDEGASEDETANDEFGIRQPPDHADDHPEEEEEATEEDERLRDHRVDFQLHDAMPVDDDGGERRPDHGENRPIEEGPLEPDLRDREESSDPDSDEQGKRGPIGLERERQARVLGLSPNRDDEDEHGHPGDEASPGERRTARDQRKAEGDRDERDGRDSLHRVIRDECEGENRHDGRKERDRDHGTRLRSPSRDCARTLGRTDFAGARGRRLGDGRRLADFAVRLRLENGWQNRLARRSLLAARLGTDRRSPRLRESRQRTSAPSTPKRTWRTFSDVLDHERESDRRREHREEHDDRERSASRSGQVGTLRAVEDLERHALTRRYVVLQRLALDVRRQRFAYRFARSIALLGDGVTAMMSTIGKSRGAAGRLCRLGDDSSVEFS